MNGDSRTQKSIKNISYNLLNQVVALILSFISRTVFIWGFGIEYLGMNGLFSDVMGLLSMVDLGFNTAMTFSYYKPLADHDEEKLAALVWFYRKVYLLIAVLIAIVGLAIIPVLPSLLTLEKSIPLLNVYYLFALATVVSSYLFVYRTSILTASQNGYIITKINLKISLCKTVIQIFSILLLKNYILYLVIGTLSTLSSNMLASRAATKRFSYIAEKQTLSKEDKRTILSGLGSMMVFKISSVMITATDNLIISGLITTAMVGFYSNYLLIQTKIVDIYSLFFASVTASVGNLIATESPAKRYNVFVCEQTACYIISGIVVPCYIVLVNDFVKLWLGSYYQLQSSTAFFIGMNMYLACVLQPLWSYREASGLFQSTKWAMFACAVLNVILSIFLGKIIGLDGIIVSSCLSRMLTYMWYEPKILFKKYFRKKTGSYFFHLFLNFSYVFLGSIFSQYIGQFFLVSSFKHWILKAAVVFLVNIGATIIVYSRFSGMKLLIERIKGF